MKIVELHTLSGSQVQDLLSLMAELNASLPVTLEMLRAVASSESAHLFAAVSEDQIVGTASLCIFVSPTGRKAKIEHVVVSSACRGMGLGKDLVEYALEFARKHYTPVEVSLTSNPSRFAANHLYHELGFQPYETNVYKLKF